MNYKFLILLLMVFCHIIDDYYLQGWLADGKQKSWWKALPNYSDKYKYDYIMVLLTHSFVWTFCIMLPVLFINYSENNNYLQYA